MKKPWLSFSQMNAFRNCKKFYHEFYDKNSTRSAVYGSFMHDVLSTANKYIKGLKNIDLLSMADIEKIYSREFKKINLSLEDYKSGYDKIEKIAFETFNNKAQIFLAEEEIEIELYDKETKKSILLKCRIDRVDKYRDGLKIIDYKSSPLVPTHAEVTNSFQLNIYAIVMRTLQPAIPIYLEYYSIGAGVGVCVPLDESVMAKTKDYAIDLWRKMEDEKEFKAEDLNEMCKYCPEVCEIYKEKIFEKYESKGVKDLKSALEQFEKVRLTRLLAEKDEDNIKELIRDKWDQGGGQPITVKDKTVDFKLVAKTTQKIDKEKICKECPAISEFASAYQKMNIASSGKEKKGIDKGKVLV